MASLHQRPNPSGWKLPTIGCTFLCHFPFFFLYMNSLKYYVYQILLPRGNGLKIISLKIICFEQKQQLSNASCLSFCNLKTYLLQNYGHHVQFQTFANKDQSDFDFTRSDIKWCFCFAVYGTKNDKNTMFQSKDFVWKVQRSLEGECQAILTIFSKKKLPLYSVWRSQ